MGEAVRLPRLVPLSRRLCLLRRQWGARLASLLELHDRLPAVIPDSSASQPWAMAALGTPVFLCPARDWLCPHGAGAARRPGRNMAYSSSTCPGSGLLPPSSAMAGTAAVGARSWQDRSREQRHSLGRQGAS